MGNSSSKSNSEAVAEICANAMLKVSSECNVASNVEQGINISGNNNILDGIDMEQTYDNVISCTSDATMMSKMQEQMIADLKNQASAQSDSIFGALSKANSDVNTIIRNTVKQNMTAENITKMVNEMKAAQRINISGSGNVVKNISLNQMITNMTTNVQKMLASTDLGVKLDADADASAKSVQKNPVSEWLDSVFGFLSLWVILLFLGFVVIAILLYKFGPGFLLALTGKNTTPPAQQAT